MVRSGAGKIIIVSNNANFMTSLCKILSDFEYVAAGFTQLKNALEALNEKTFDVLLTDMDAQKNESISFLKTAMKTDPSLMCILIAKQEKMHATLEALKAGVFDYIIKPFKIEVLLMAISRALEVRKARREKEIYYSIFENSAEGIYLADREGRFITANLPLAHLFGYDSPDELIKSVSRSKSRLYTEADRSAEIMRIIRNRDVTTGIESEACRRNGEKILISENVRAVRDSGGNILFYRGSIQDITLQKKNGRNLQRNKKDEGNTDFLFEMIDDICESYKNLEDLFLGFVMVIVNTIDEKSPWSKGHSMRVAFYAEKIGRELGLHEEQIKKLRLAGLLHDIGRIGTLASLFDKQTPLTREEMELMKKHPVEGASILTKVNQMKDIIPYVRHHHERIDGKGYPDGPKGEKIPFLARILHVAESFDSMTVDRPYRLAPGREYAISEIDRCKGSQFDPQVSEVALKVL